MYEEFIATLEVLAEKAKTYNGYMVLVKEKFGILPLDYEMRKAWEKAVARHDAYVKRMEKRIGGDYILKRCEGCREVKLMKPDARACSRVCTGILAMRASGSNNAYTRPELVFMRWLIEHNLLFVPQWIDGYMRPDFYLFPNICVYVDSYYHNLHDGRNRDARITAKLKLDGYVVVRIEDVDLYKGYRPDWILDVAWKGNNNEYGNLRIV